MSAKKSANLAQTTKLKMIFESFGLSLVFFVLSCSSQSASLLNKQQPTSTQWPSDPDVVYQTKFGQSSRAVFSPSGEKIAFISWDRKESQSEQIFEYDMILQKETQLSFQAGHISSVSFWSENELLYSSDTDEIKENLFSSSKKIPNKQGDIYLKSSNQDEILRLTRSSGQETNPVRNPWSKKSFYYISTDSSQSNFKPGLYEFDLNSHKSQLVLAGSFSKFIINKNQNSILLLEDLGRNPKALLYNVKQKKQTELPLPSENVLALSLGPWDDVYMIAESYHLASSDYRTRLFYWNPKTFCLNLYREIPGQVDEMQISPRGQSLLAISSAIEKKSQVFLYRLNLKAPSCALP